MVGSGRSAETLVAGGDEDAVEALARELASGGHGFAVATVTDPETVPAAADAEDFDALVVEPSEDWPDPGTVLEEVREREPGIPVLFVVDADEEMGDVLADANTDLHVAGSVGGTEALRNRLAHMIDARTYRRRFGDDRPGFATIVANLPGMVYRAAVSDPWPMYYVGGSVEELTGYAPSAIEDGDVVWGEDVVVEDDVARVEGEVVEAVEDRRTFEVTYGIRTADGAVKDVWERGVGVYDGEEPVALDGFIMEASDGPASAER